MTTVASGVNTWHLWWAYSKLELYVEMGVHRDEALGTFSTTMVQHLEVTVFAMMALEAGGHLTQCPKSCVPYPLLLQLHYTD